MTVKETAHAYKLRQWTELICDCKTSGKSVTAWCAEHSINVKTYYYWQKRVREAACEKMEKANLPMVPTGGVPAFAEYRQLERKEASSAITLHISGATIEIHNGADASIITNTLNALKNIC
jgi:hypothetical protein